MLTSLKHFLTSPISPYIMGFFHVNPLIFPYHHNIRLPTFAQESLGLFLKTIYHSYVLSWAHWRPQDMTQGQRAKNQTFSSLQIAQQHQYM